MKSEVLRCSSSSSLIVSRAWCAGALSCWKVNNVSRNMSYCRQKFLQQKIPVILSVNLPSGITNTSSVSASKCWHSNRYHQWLAEDCAHEQQSCHWDILLSQGTGHVKTVIRCIWSWGSDSKNLLICELEKVNITVAKALQQLPYAL